MAFEAYIANKKAFILGLDNVLYPEKDYLLQVFYLFAEFLEYTEQLNSKEIITFMQAEFLLNGSKNIFDKTAEKFKISLKYKNNFNLLHQTAKLPLKLLLYKQMLSVLQEIVLKGKEIFLLADGDPLQQLNKIKQMEWHGLAPNLKLYFSEEFGPKPNVASLQFITTQNKLKLGEILMIGNSNLDEINAKNFGIEYFNVIKLL